MPADTLKIVYKGKTVTNEDSIEKLGIKETDFIVVMAQVQVPLSHLETSTQAKGRDQTLAHQIVT